MHAEENAARHMVAQAILVIHIQSRCAVLVLLDKGAIAAYLCYSNCAAITVAG